MCEMLGVTSDKKIRINDLLGTFYNHSVEHRNGWGLALLDDETPIEKEAKRALDSMYMKNKLNSNIETAKCIAHIRKATIGEVSVNNAHPFERYDDSGRRWVLAHNGTIFDSEALAPYQYTQTGTTDSERILLYIVDQMNKRYRNSHDLLSADLRIDVVEKAVRTIVPGNKLNLLIYDGELFYVHKNEAGTLYKKEKDDGIIFSTVPLDPYGWEEFPQNRLMVYKNGKLVYTGRTHDSTYIHNEEKMRLLYFAYSGL